MAKLVPDKPSTAEPVVEPVASKPLIAHTVTKSHFFGLLQTTETYYTQQIDFNNFSTSSK